MSMVVPPISPRKKLTHDENRKTMPTVRNSKL